MKRFRIYAFGLSGTTSTKTSQQHVTTHFNCSLPTVLTPAHHNQITQIIANIDEQKQKVPYLADLTKHPVYGPLLAGIDDDDKATIKQLIATYIDTKIAGLTTKGGQLFRRFAENNSELFRDFRALNEFEASTDTKPFQELGKEVEKYMFDLENVLTSKMLKKDQGLEKTIDAFYTIVYSFFPLYGRIES